MGVECAYSFWDLFKSVHGRFPTKKERDVFLALSQEERNRQIEVWTAHIGWETENRIGTDGIAYTAFAPKF